jgi:hypothetical protein
MFSPQDLNLANQSSSNFLFENVNKMLSTFVPAHHRRESNQVKKIKQNFNLTLSYFSVLLQLFSAMGVKSHGTITCKIKKLI